MTFKIFFHIFKHKTSFEHAISIWQDVKPGQLGKSKLNKKNITFAMFDVKSGLAAEAKKQSRKYNISSHPIRPRRKRSPEMMACTVPETPEENVR